MAYKRYFKFVDFTCNLYFFIILIGSLFGLNGCISTKNQVKTGNEAYDLKQYAHAISLFKNELIKENRKEVKAKIYYTLGNCYEKILDYNMALESYVKAENFDHGVSSTLKKAYMLKQLMKYEEAANTFESISNTSLSNEVRQQTAVCKSLLGFQKKAATEITIDNLFENSYYSDYGVSVFDDDYLVITSDREESSGGERYKWTGNKFSDLFIVDKDNNVVKRFDSVINTEQNEGTPTFTKDYNTMVFTRCFSGPKDKDEVCKLMLSKRINGIWTDASELPFLKSDVNYGQPCFFEQDSVLIFASKAEINANGYDLWYSEFDGINFGEPFPLPEIINTTNDEYFPTADGDTLYFSSDHLNGYGGLDLYKTWVNAEGKWEKPLLLAYPFNTGGDDFSLVIDRKDLFNKNQQIKGYLTSTRRNNGRDEIFRFKTIVKSEDVVKNTSKNDADKKNNKKIYLALKTMAFKLESFVLNTDRAKIKLPFSSVKIMINGKEFNNGSTDKNGLYILEIPPDAEIDVSVSKDTYLSNSIKFDTRSLLNTSESSSTINKEVVLDQLLKGREIQLENIYYEYDKWDITSEAEISLNKLIKIMKDNPQIYIELGSHTDCRGAEDYNQELSQKRAQSAIDYMVYKGKIEPARMQAKGYGEGNLADSCLCDICTETQHLSNRRTTFKIL